MKIKQIVNSVLQSNTYILYFNDDTDVALIDIGDVAPVLSSLKENQSIGNIFLTHTHYDHIYGLPHILKVFPECKIYTSKFGHKALQSSKLNLSKYHNDSIICNPSQLQILSQDDIVKVYDSYVEVMETPGHDKSCLSYIIGNNLFSGDSYIPGYKVLSTLPNSNRDDAISSELRLSELSKSNNLFPGHHKTFLID